VAALGAQLKELQAKYDSREPRPEDAQLIESLRRQMKEKDEMVRRTYEEMKYFKMELQNREENFNSKFGAQPRVGTLNPLASSKRDAKDKDGHGGGNGGAGRRGGALGASGMAVAAATAMAAGAGAGAPAGAPMGRRAAQQNGVVALGAGQAGRAAAQLPTHGGGAAAGDPGDADLSAAASRGGSGGSGVSAHSLSSGAPRPGPGPGQPMGRRRSSSRVDGAVPTADALAPAADMAIGGPTPALAPSHPKKNSRERVRGSGESGPMASGAPDRFS